MACARPFLAVLLAATMAHFTLAGRLRRGADTRVLPAAFDVLGEDKERTAAVRAVIAKTYDAIPKSVTGLVPVRDVMPDIVRGYFAKEYGWMIRGLEPLGLMDKVTEVHEANLLKEKAPELAKALQEARTADLGIGEDTVIAVIAALEHLVLEDSMPVLKGVYDLRNQSTVGDIDQDDLHNVLASFLLLFRQGRSRDLADPTKLSKMLGSVQKNAALWDGLMALEQSALAGVAAPGSNGGYDFAAVANVARDLTLRYGKWSNSECVEMKESLMDLDPDGTGRVPFDVFHNQPNHSKFQFTESIDYLRSIRAIEELEGGEPHVLLANYIEGPSNCIASSEFYAVCCLSECEQILTKIESSVRKESSAPTELLKIVEAITPASEWGRAPWSSPELGKKLQDIATANNGAVPLRGADFRQWLHSAFPRECPRPATSSEGAPAPEPLGIMTKDPVLTDCTRVHDWEAAHGHVADTWSANLWFHAPERDAGSELEL